MAIGLVTKKLGMTRFFLETGLAVPITLLKASDCTVTQIKDFSNNGYTALQLGYGPVPTDKLNKPELGHLKKAGVGSLKHLTEFRIPEKNLDDFTIGQTLDSTLFDKGETVQITGNSIGKGFAGNQKRNNFTIGPMTHGSKNHRAPGSIGQGSTPARVYPGKKMAGQLGNCKVTITKSEIIYVDTEKGIIAVKGSVPGKKGAFVRISKKSI